MQVHKIVFDRAITTRDLQEQLAVAVGLNRLANVILKAKGDTIITISPTMLGNNSRLVPRSVKCSFITPTQSLSQLSGRNDKFI